MMLYYFIVLLDILVVLILVWGLCSRLNKVLDAGYMTPDDRANIVKNLSFSIVVYYPFLQEYAIYANDIAVKNEWYIYGGVAYKLFCVGFSWLAIYHAEIMKK